MCTDIYAWIYDIKVPVTCSSLIYHMISKEFLSYSLFLCKKKKVDDVLISPKILYIYYHVLSYYHIIVPSYFFLSLLTR